MNYLTPSLLVLLLTINTTVKAELFKRVDEFGNVTYTNLPPRGSVQEPTPAIAPPELAPRPVPSKAASASTISKTDQARRDVDRVQNLQAELTKAQASLKSAVAAKADALALTRLHADIESLTKELALARR